MKGSTLQAHILTYLKEETTCAINIMNAGQSGWPDIIACIKGDFFGFEVKGDTDTEKALQEQKFLAIYQAGGYGGFVYSVEQVKNIIRYKLRTVKPDIKTLAL